MNLYQNLAQVLCERIEQGFYAVGVRLPSVRVLSNEHRVSISTVQQAYRILEEKKLVEARPKSGYFVSHSRPQAALPEVCRPAQRPVDITQWDQVLEILMSKDEGDVLHLGRGSPDITSPSLKPLSQALARASQHRNLLALKYDNIYGYLPLREQIARLMIDSGNNLDAENIITTTGCHEALSIAIRSVCDVGDIVAVDSPSFHGVMQTLRGYGMKALEIPTDPVTGMSIEALELALEQWPIKAIQVTPSCNNPLGYNMPDDRKKALIRLAQCYDIAIIEDDVYGDLAFQYPRPATIASFDDEGRVILCSSFSKTLAPGLRIGWMVPGRYLNRALHMKYISTGSNAVAPQIALSDFIRQGHYAQHLRRIRNQYQRNLCDVTCWLSTYFPCGVRVSRPQGGYMLWVELDSRIDTQRLNKLLLEHKVQIAVGSIFSASGKYRNCLRINYAQALDERYEQGIKAIGQMISHMMENP